MITCATSVVVIVIRNPRPDQLSLIAGSEKSMYSPLSSLSSSRYWPQEFILALGSGLFALVIQFRTFWYIGCLQSAGSTITRKSTWNFKIWVRFVKYRSSLSREWNLHEYGPVVVKLEHFEVGTPKTLTPSTLRKKFPSSLGSDGLGIAPIIANPKVSPPQISRSMQHIIRGELKNRI